MHPFQYSIYHRKMKRRRRNDAVVSSRSLLLLLLCCCCISNHVHSFQPPFKVNGIIQNDNILIQRQRQQQRQGTSLSAISFDFINNLPFEELSSQLSDALDIGADFLSDSNEYQPIGGIPEAETTIVLQSVGRDLLVFLTSSVIVTLCSSSINISPILGYLVAGAFLGPHGINIFSNAKADVELGDFGILFLLFSEGLEVSKSRLKQLSNYLPLGFAQISLTTGVITAAILLGAPQFLDRVLPLDEGFIDIQNPTEAVVLALAGTLSTCE